MHGLQQTLNIQTKQATTKVSGRKKPLRYFLSSLLAGFFIGLAVVLMFCSSGPFAVSDHPATKLISGVVFAVGLVLVVFAGAELATGAMMILTQGILSKKIKVSEAIVTLMFCLLGNLSGSILCAWMAIQSGVLSANSAAEEFLFITLDNKISASSSELFFRAILCNILVCLAIWSVNRSETEIGKATVIFWCLLAFVTSGYEHVVANMTTFSLGIFSPLSDITWVDFVRNMSLVGFGNLVGGALFVGVIYWIISRPEKEFLEKKTNNSQTSVSIVGTSNAERKNYLS